MRYWTLCQWDHDPDGLWQWAQLVLRRQHDELRLDCDWNENPRAQCRSRSLALSILTSIHE